MKKDVSLVASKAQKNVCNAMDEINRATKKVLLDYIHHMYFYSLAKAVAYLELPQVELDCLLDNMPPETGKKILEIAKGYKKSDECVITEARHIFETSGMNVDDCFMTIKENLLQTDKSFAHNAVEDFKKTNPIFCKQIGDCLFCFEDIILLDNRAIQKIIREADQQELAKALKGASTELQAQFFSNMSKRDSDMLKEDMEFMGPVRLSDVEKARAYIVGIVFRQEESGDIVIIRNQPDEQLID